jgi:transposase
VYYALEDHFAVWLCNAHHVKNVPGRKTDMSDAEWLADVVAHGMVRPSFVPPPPDPATARSDPLPQAPSRHARR